MGGRVTTTELARVNARLSIAEDALRAIADPSCGVEDAGDGYPSWDADTGYKIARATIEKLRVMP